MNIYDFFDSRDIAEYCKSIDYKPSALESAFVIWHSRFHTIKQKHNAWQEIINTYPDEKINTGHSWLDKKGLHAFLRQYMQKQNELLARFEALEKDIVFSYSVTTSNGIDYDDTPYYNYDVCLSEAKKDYDGLIDKSDVSEIAIVKRKIHNTHGDSDFEMTLTLNTNFEPIDIGLYEYGKSVDDDKYILDGFTYLWVKIPTPFKYGDLVTVRTYSGDNEEPMVLAWIPYWPTSEGRDMSKIVTRFLQGNGDFTDMQATFYYQDRMTGEISRDHGADYLSLEYYKGELTGKQRFLLAIKNYLQNIICLDDLLRAHSVILLEEYAKDLRNCGKIDSIMKNSGLA